GEGIDLVEDDVARLFWGDDDAVIPLGQASRRLVIVVTPYACRIAIETVADGEAIGTCLVRIERELIAAADSGHGVGLEVVVVISGGDEAAVDGLDAVLDAVAIGVELGAVAAVEVGVNLAGLDVGGLGI